jgi:mannose/cellobiose epimerase-like protein (N-acyl-D-glucosamine 2-epimerase family)
MHLTEACLAAFEATGEARFSTLAKEIVGVFTRRFFDLESRDAGRVFHGRPCTRAGDDGRIVEPGHQLEWAWILNSCRKQLGLQVAPQIRALASFAETNGVDPVTKITFNTFATMGRRSTAPPAPGRIRSGSRRRLRCTSLMASIRRR